MDGLITMLEIALHETHARNQPTEVVWLPPRKDPNQQAMLGHMHDLFSRSLSCLVTKHDLIEVWE